jgi:hypothetical protein
MGDCEPWFGEGKDAEDPTGFTPIGSPRTPPSPKLAASPPCEMGDRPLAVCGAIGCPGDDLLTNVLASIRTWGACAGIGVRRLRDRRIHRRTNSRPRRRSLMKSPHFSAEIWNWDQLPCSLDRTRWFCDRGTQQVTVGLRETSRSMAIDRATYSFEEVNNDHQFTTKYRSADRQHLTI